MGLPRISRVSVPTVGDMQNAIASYAAQGFVVINKTDSRVTMQKRKEFSLLWASIGLLVCLLPFVVYLIYYATQPEVEVVDILIG
jgi:hypothetical protein